MSRPLARLMAIANVPFGLRADPGEGLVFARQNTNPMFSSKQRGTGAWAGLAFGAVSAALAGLPSGPLALGEAAGQPLDALYVGKQIRMVIAAGAGGGYDA